MTPQRSSRRAKTLRSTTSTVSASAPSDSRPSSAAPESLLSDIERATVEIVDRKIKLPPALPLRPYQQRWIDDPSRFKLAVKSARIGYSFATALEAILDCLGHPNTTWTVLSASKAQSVEFVETCQKLIEVMGGSSRLAADEDFVDFIGRIEAIQQRVTLPNGARIIALPANPRTARGYPGNAILDEFGHHEDSYAIWAAIIRQTALGHKVRVLSTPNGEQGKFFDLANDLGLIDGVRPAVLPVRKGPWSGHWVDVYMAVAEGCPINIEEMRAGIGDEDTWNQEFCCVFLKAMGAWLTLDLLALCEDEGASIDLPGYDKATGKFDPSLFRARGPLFAGIDVGRDHDATCLWLDEKIGDIYWTRAVIWLYAMPFPKQAEILNPIVNMTARTAIDKTGMGVGLFDLLNLKNEGRLMGVSFSGSNDNGVRMKTDLAIRIKKKFEQRKSRIPYTPQIRTELMSIKREATASGVSFDAPRIEVDTAVAGGAKKKKFAHADAFWAKALADFAAETAPIELGMTLPEQPSAYAQSKGIL
jgi:phage FluMu gp28-like protein